MDVDQLFSRWPGEKHGVIGFKIGERAPESLLVLGDVQSNFALASLTKLITAVCAATLVESGYVGFDEVIDQNGATLRMALSHAAGYAPDSEQLLALPGTRRIYSNYGYEKVATYLSNLMRTPFAELAQTSVLSPLGMSNTVLDGHPAYGARGTVGDLVSLAYSLQRTGFLSHDMLSVVTSTQFLDLGGVLPGFGRMEPCPWGAGAEVKGMKSPHWSGSSFGPTSFGHFGRAGGFLLVDPDRKVAVVALGDVDFGSWAIELWPGLTDLVVELL